MRHLDPDRLVLIALGEQAPSPEESAHLGGCATCGPELSATRAVVGAGRTSHGVRELPPAPDALWDRIAAEALAPEPRRVATPARRTDRWRFALVAAIAAVVGIGATIAVQQARQHTDKVVAVADLRPQAAAPAGAHGTVTIVDTGHGLQMRITVTGMPATTGYYDVWLYDGGNVMVPLGPTGSAPLNVPPSAADLSRFRIVDVSAQDLGQQEHGTSMLQGNLAP